MLHTIKELKENLTKNYKDNDEIFVAYWDKEWVADEFEMNDVELTDEVWTVFKHTLEIYTKNNGLSSDLISEVVYEIINNIEENENE